jgi:predicted Zn-dependent protease
VVYIVAGQLYSKKRAVCGVASREVGIVSLGNVFREKTSKVSYASWSALVWEVLLHELGHCFGLIQRRSREIKLIGGVRHCANDCVMSEEIFSSVWKRSALLRKQEHRPYCPLCRAYLEKKRDL